MTRSSLLSPGLAFLLAFLLLSPSPTSAQGLKEIWELPLGLNWNMSLQDLTDLLTSKYGVDDDMWEVDSSSDVDIVRWDDFLYGDHYVAVEAHTTVESALYEVQIEHSEPDEGRPSLFRRISAQLRADYGEPDLDFSLDHYDYSDEEITTKVYDDGLEVYEQWHDTIDGNAYVVRHEFSFYSILLHWTAYGVGG